MKKRELTSEEKSKRKVERFKKQNINPYPIKKVTGMIAIRDSRGLIRSRKGSDPSGPEKIISDYLKSVGVKFTREWYSKELFSKITGKLLFFDFYLPEYKSFIEYDGPYHFSGKNIAYQKFNDSLKDEFCRKRRYPFLRITYKQHGELMPMLETFIRTIETLKL